MAKRTIHMLVDDIDGGEADETVTFAVDGSLGRHRGSPLFVPLQPRTGDDRETDNDENGGFFQVAWHAGRQGNSCVRERRRTSDRLPGRGKPRF